MKQAAVPHVVSTASPKGSYRDLFDVLIRAKVDVWILGTAAILTLVEVAATLGFPLLTRTLVDGAGRTGELGGVLRLSAVWQLVAVLLAAAIASAVARYLTSCAGLKLGVRLKTAMVERLLRAPLHYLDDFSSGELTSRTLNDTKAFAQLISRETLNAISAALLLIGAGVILFSLDRGLASLLFGVIGAAFLAILPVALKMTAISFRVQAETASLSSRLTQVFGEIRMVKTFGTEAHEIGHAETGLHALFRLGRRSARIEAALNPVMTLAVTCSLVAILAYGGMRVASGTLSSGTLTAFLLYIFTVVGPLAQLTGFFSQLASARGSSTRIAEVLRLASECTDRLCYPSLGGMRKSRTLRIEKLRFAYAAGDNTRPSLAVDFLDFAPGSRTAIIGPSGSGKSTLLALIERLYAPTEGRILYGGQDIAASPLRQWRSRIGYVSQVPAMLSGTVRENLLYGIDRPVGEDEIAEALALSCAGAFVTALPDSLETQIGERGSRLSGGERQRLAIARLFLRDPEILLLDEATSSLDEENAHLVLRGLDALMRGRTCILVTHRLNGLEAMDQIVSLDAGRLVEIGTPTSLLAETSLYRRLVHRQFLDEVHA